MSAAPNSAIAVTVSELPSLKREPFTRLKMRHRVVIALHLQGLLNRDIAQCTGYSVGSIRDILGNPTVKELLNTAYADFESEIKALTPKSIEAISSALESGDHQAALRAAAMQLELAKVGQSTDDRALTAEDLIERVLEITRANGDAVRVSERRIPTRSLMALTGGASDDSHS